MQPDRNSRWSLLVACLISLAIHAALGAAVWYSMIRYRTSSDVPPPVSVELVTTAAHEESRPTAKAVESPQPAIKPVSAHVPLNAAQIPVVVTTAKSADPSAPATVAMADSAEPADVGASEQTADGSSSQVTSRVLEWLGHFKNYPLAARRSRLEGTVRVQAVLMPDGRLVARRLQETSGHPILDAAALELLERASPIPKEFVEASAQQVELRLPISYRMKN